MSLKHVLIDGVYTPLTYDRFSGARGHQYLTLGNTASHAFPEALVVGQKFHTNGHDYEVLASKPAEELPEDFDLSDEEEAPAPDTCAACGGPVQELGGLGQLTWYRCRNCGHDSSRTE